MINYDIVATRIAKIRKMLVYLKEVPTKTKEEYEKDIRQQLITERSLQITAQAILDIRNHIIAHFSWGKPESYHEIISTLVTNKIVSEEYKSQLEGLTGLRNILVHGYLTINPNILYKDVVNGIKAIKAFIYEIEKKFHPKFDKTSNSKG
ncbi:MAG: DUF86 domain-containing protein [Promethearchaeota archaeon]